MILNFSITNNIWVNYSLNNLNSLDFLNYKINSNLSISSINFQNYDIFKHSINILDYNTNYLNSLWSFSIKSSNMLLNGVDDYYYISYIILNIFSIVIFFICSIFFLSIFYEKHISLFFKKLINLITTFISNCLSYYEVISLLSSYIMISIFFFVVSLCDEDISDMLLFLIFVFLIFLLYGLLMSLGFIKCYFFLNSNNSGYAFKKKISDDIINFNLSLLRIFVCWVRYIFYDLQVDFIDMLLIYTEDVNFDIYENNFILNIFYKFLIIILDLILYLLLILLCFVKLSIASFLMWLIIDLFLLRISFFVSEEWLLNSIKKILLSNLKKK